MLNRNVSLVVCLSIFAGAAFAQSSNQGTGYVFQFANTTATSGQFQAFLYNSGSLGTPVFNTTGPVGANQVIAKPDGSKFYVVGSGGVDEFNSTFTTPVILNGITGTPNSGQAIITPDGRYLLIAASLGGGASVVHVLNTTNDTVVLNQTISGSVIQVVASHDSQTAWILGASSQSFITILNLPASGAPQQVGSPVILRDPITGASLAGDPQAMTLSPLSLLYVSAGNQILEIAPATLAAAAPSGIFQSGQTPVAVGVNATAGPLQFTPDGTSAYFINSTPQYGGQSLLRMSLPSHTIISWPPYTPGQQAELFDNILVASPTRLFAHSPGDTTLWDVAADFSTVGVSALNSVLQAGNVLSIAESNEIPTARYLYALVGSGSLASLYRVDLTTNSVNSQAAVALGSGTLQFSVVPPETNPTGFLQFNATQTLAAGATAATLIARVLDPTGRPMFAVPVSFTGDSSLTFTGVTATTNADGYAQATVTVGQTSGSYPVTLTAGSGANVASTTFALTIPGAGGGGGPTGGGPNQMTIVAGNGQLYRSGFSNTDVPLTVQLLDTNGKPLVNQNVTFTIVGLQIAVLSDPNATTDSSGMATTYFYAQQIAQNTGFQQTTVTAVAAQGSVTFNETVWQPDSTGSPVSATVLAPTGTQTLIAGEGDVIPGAIVGAVSLYAFGTSAQIPNVAMTITNADGSGSAGPGTCQGNPLTDMTGTVTCNFVASCTAGLGLHGFIIDFGQSIDKLGYSVNVVPGQSRALAILSGNNQTGRPGNTIPLSATVTDQCGSPAAGVTVTWKVVQGSATLSSASTASGAGGGVSTTLTLGNVPGTVQVVASISTTTLVTFTETVTALVGNLRLVSGGGQSALLNQGFAAPLIFQITDTNGNPVSALTVSFSLAGGSASISATSAVSNAQGQVSVNVTAGNTAGAVTISATYTTFTATASLTVTAPGPSVTVSSFVNAASGQIGLTPCALALVTGAGLAPGVSGITLWNPLGIGPFVYTLAGVTITINGTPAPLQAVSNQGGIQQVNFQTPCETVPGSPATVVVQVGSVSTQVGNVTVYPAQPGIFTFAGIGGANYPYAVDTHGNVLGPSNLAQAGQTYYMFTTGLGAVPGVTTDSVGNNQALSASSIILAINNTPVTVNSVQYLQGAIGEYLITFTIPVPFQTGTNLPMTLGMTVNSQTFFDNSPVTLPGIH
jgi:uncharacterized protein (TIGR03437 family)